jgi:hypothetical protein
VFAKNSKPTALIAANSIWATEVAADNRFQSRRGPAGQRMFISIYDEPAFVAGAESPSAIVKNQAW